MNIGICCNIQINSIHITWHTNPEALQDMLIEMQMGNNNLENPCSKNKNPIFDITDAILKSYFKYFFSRKMTKNENNPTSMLIL